jgi:hypothetical protein
LSDRDYGPCCACGSPPTRRDPVRTFVALSAKAPVPGTGWGCVVCRLPADGAIAVVCDACVAAAERAGAVPPIREVFAGYPNDGRRVPPADCPPGEHRHDPRSHPEMAAEGGAE